MLQKSTVLALGTMAALYTSAIAQAPPQPPSNLMRQDVQQLPEMRGVVQRFTLTPRGDLDGFLLADNTDVHVPPHLSQQLAATVHPGDTVLVRGYRSGAVPLVVAAVVTNAATGQSVIDQGPPAPGFGPPPPPPPAFGLQGAQQAWLSGKVVASLYGPAGDLNGAVLDDGTIVRMPPHVAYQYAPMLAPGQTVTTQGLLLATPNGRVLDAQSITAAAPQR